MGVAKYLLTAQPRRFVSQVFSVIGVSKKLVLTVTVCETKTLWFFLFVCLLVKTFFSANDDSTLETWLFSSGSE